jgi:hypothetical protein
MISEVPIEIFSASVAIIGVLGRATFVTLNDKIKNLEKAVCEVPTLQIKVDIADMKNDIAWLKSFLLKQQ